jgi:replicative DNA helicase
MTARVTPLRPATTVNLKAEEAFIGCLLRAGHDYFQVADLVQPSHMSSPLLRDIYIAIREVCEANRPLSMTALQAKLPEEFEGQPIIAHLTVLKANAEDAGSARDYAEAIAEAASRRQLITLAESLIKAAKSGERSAVDVASEAEAALLDVLQLAAPRRPKRLSEIAEQVTAASRLAQEREIMPGFTTGLPSLDEMVGLIMGGDFVVVLGSQGDGKSALLTQVGIHIAQARPVLSFHNEMGEEQIGARQIAAAAGMSVREVREGAFDMSGWEAVKDARRRLAGPEYWVMAEPKLTVRQIRHHALTMKRTIGLGAVTIDQLTHIRSDTKHRDRFDRLAEITSDLKQLAMELACPVILAAQRTRTAQRREDPTPQIDDADAPSIERDADSVMAIWRMENWLRRNKPPQKAGGEAMESWEHKVRNARGIAEIITLKVRSGQAYEQRQFKWDGAATTVREL